MGERREENPPTHPAETKEEGTSVYGTAKAEWEKRGKGPSFPVEKSCGEGGTSR